MKIRHCPTHGAYAAPTCPRCPEKSGDSGAKPILNRTKVLSDADNPETPQNSDLDDFAIPKFLQPHFDTVEDMLAGLADGRVTSAVRGLQSGNETKTIQRYWQMVDTLVAAGYPVGHYKHRMVSWRHPDA